MNITFFSNYFNHHQFSLSEELNKRTTNYKFVSTKEMGDHRKSLGYVKNNRSEYVIELHKSSNKTEKTKEIIDETSVFIGGSAPENILHKCIKTNRLFFRYSERPFKKESSILYFFKMFIKERIKNPMSKPIYMLCASAYTPLDYSRLFLFKNRTYKWGYFPKAKIYDIDALITEKKSAEILWCGRFINWKHPDDAIKAISRLKKDGYNVLLKFIGTGDMESQLKNMIKEYDTEENVVFLGSMSPEEVREHMERSGIYLFTSDKQEGWGVVLNESMNSGCAVIASHLIGSVPFLINNNENGLVYESGNIDMLYEKIKFLLDNPEIQQKLGKNAYKTIITEWNAEVAAERFLNLTQHILNGEHYPDLYKNGPCSKAEIIKEDWLKKEKERI